MKKITALLTLAGIAGIGYYIYKKMNEQKDDTTAYTEYKEKISAGDRVRRASMYAVGTIKTTADKISEGIQQVKTGDMVKKGEETVEHMKETTGEIKEHVIETTNGIKEEIKEIKNLVTSINVSPADNAFETEIEADSEMPTVNYEDELDLFDTAEPAEQL